MKRIVPLLVTDVDAGFVLQKDLDAFEDVDVEAGASLFIFIFRTAVVSVVGSADGVQGGAI